MLQVQRQETVPGRQVREPVGDAPGDFVKAAAAGGEGISWKAWRMGVIYPADSGTSAAGHPHR